MYRYESMLLFLLLVIALVWSGCSPVAQPYAGSVPDRILFIGTSDTASNEGVYGHLQGMAASATPSFQIEADSVILPGEPLERMWQSSSVQEGIQQGGWDVVVLEGEFAMGDVDSDEESYRENVRKFDELIRSAGARPMLFMDWPLNIEGEYADLYHRPRIEEIAEVISRSGEEINAEVAPVGLAFERALAERPDLDLYKPDRIHASARGTYLTTAVFYATLFNRSPEGVPYGLEEILPEHKAYDDYRAKYTLPEEERAFLQQIAWETVQAYQIQ